MITAPAAGWLRSSRLRQVRIQRKARDVTGAPIPAHAVQSPKYQIKNFQRSAISATFPFDSEAVENIVGCIRTSAHCAPTGLQMTLLLTNSRMDPLCAIYPRHILI